MRRSSNRRQLHQVLILAILLLGAVLRISALGSYARFHPDEALYATFARRISLQGDFLLSDASLDKPPLAPLVIAGAFKLFGTNEFAARIPSVFASLLTLALIYALSRRCYNERITTVVGLVWALSPLDIAFAPTAFLDPLLLLWFAAALWLVSRDRWWMAGIASALAIWTKQSALQFLPLILFLGFVVNAERGWPWQYYWRRFRGLALMILIGATLLALWSAARAAPVDFWTLGVYNNNPGRFIRDSEILPRLEIWLDYLGYIPGVVPLLILALVPAISSYRIKCREQAVDLLLAGYVLTSLFAYWLIAFNTYDRYVLPLAPLVVILVVRGGEQVLNSVSQFYARKKVASDETKTVIVGILIIAILIVCVMPFTWAAVRGDVPIGGDHGTYTGIDVFADQLNALTGGAPVYEHWLGWELDYYLGDHPMTQLIWQPSVEVMGRAVCAPSQKAYFAAPADEAKPWLTALIGTPITAKQVIGGKFVLYQLTCDEAF